MDFDLIKLADLLEGVSREIKRVYGESSTDQRGKEEQAVIDASVESTEEPHGTPADVSKEPTTVESEPEQSPNQNSRFADLEDAGVAATDTSTQSTTTQPPTIPPVNSGSAIPSVTQNTQTAEQQIQRLQEELRTARLEAANQGTFNFQPLHLS